MALPLSPSPASLANKAESDSYVHYLRENYRDKRECVENIEDFLFQATLYHDYVLPVSIGNILTEGPIQIKDFGLYDDLSQDPVRHFRASLLSPPDGLKIRVIAMSTTVVSRHLRHTAHNTPFVDSPEGRELFQASRSAIRAALEPMALALEMDPQHLCDLLPWFTPVRQRIYRNRLPQSSITCPYLCLPSFNATLFDISAICHAPPTDCSTCMRVSVYITRFQANNIIQSSSSKHLYVPTDSLDYEKRLAWPATRNF